MRVLTTVALACVLTTACGGGESNVAQGNREGIFHYGNSAEPQGLDPHAVGGTVENNIIRSLFEGLVSKDPQTLVPAPGVAASWDVSDDRLVYTFHLRADARWSNGETITASDFVWSWHRALHPETGNRYAYMLHPVLNAEAFNAGRIKNFDDVGVRALDEQTLEVTLQEPTPYFLQLMDHHAAYAVHPETVLAFGEMTDRFTPWTRPGNFVGSGAFVLEDWAMNRHVIVRKNPHYWDADNVALNGIVYYPTENSTSEERMFRAEQLHATATVPSDKVPHYQSFENSPLTQYPYMGSYFLWVNMSRPPLDDPRVREALALVIDRDALAEHIMKGTIYPSGNVIPPGIPGYTRPDAVTMDTDRARQLLAEAGYPNGEGWPDLELMYGSSDAGRRLMVAIQQMWKQELNIRVSLANQEWKVFLDTMDNRDYDIGSLGWVADYVDPVSFLGIFVSTAGYNMAGYDNPEFDRLVLEEAANAATPEARMAALAKAEAIMLKDLPVLPMYIAGSRQLVHPSVENLYGNVMDELNPKYISLKPGRSLPPEL